MADNVAAIRPSVEIKSDISREMVQFVAEEIARYVETTGEQPFAIALVLLGQDKGDAVSFVNSWTPADENRSRLQCCATASALLMQRALGLC